MVGEGDGKVKECAQIMHDAGYEGVIAIETAGLDDPYPGVARGVANLQRIISQCKGK